jgi:hypothetical protein
MLLINSFYYQNGCTIKLCDDNFGNNNEIIRRGENHALAGLTHVHTDRTYTYNTEGKIIVLWRY